MMFFCKWERDQRLERGRRGEGMRQRIRVWYVHVPVSYEVCNYYVPIKIKIEKINDVL